MRTRLTNERTLLAYVRTGFALAGAGATLIVFLEASLAQAAGWLLLAGGLLALGIGAARFRAIRRLSPP